MGQRTNKNYLVSEQKVMFDRSVKLKLLNANLRHFFIFSHAHISELAWPR